MLKGVVLWWQASWVFRGGDGGVVGEDGGQGIGRGVMEAPSHMLKRILRIPGQAGEGQDVPIP